MEINQGVNEEDAVWGHITGTIANQTDLFTNFIKLDQTTPQTTVGTFTFPIIKANSAEITGSLTANNLWYLDGNTLGAKKTLGSIDNQDFGIITNNTERITVLKDGNVGIGTTNPANFLSINASGATTANTQTTYPVGIGYSGATHLTFGSDASNAYIQSWNKPLYINSQGNITFFSSPVTVSSTLTMGNGIIQVPNSGALVIQSNATAKFRMLPFGNDIYFQNTNSSGNIDFTGNSGLDLTGDVLFKSTGNIKFGQAAGAASGSNVIITNTGSVGIGTTNPGARLEVKGVLKQTYSTNYASNSLLIGSGYELDGTLHSAGGYKEYIRWGNGGDGQSGWDLIFGTAANPIITIRNTGVFLGPQDFSVQKKFSWGTASMGNVLLDSTSLGGSPHSGALQFGNNSGWKFYIQNDTTKLVTFQDNGNVGIGTTNPGVLLDVVGAHISGTGLARFKGSAGSGFISLDNTTTGETGFLLKNVGVLKGQFGYNPTSGNVYIKNRGSLDVEMLSINSSGNVGIGTTNPSTKLQVNGEITKGLEKSIVQGVVFTQTADKTIGNTTTETTMFATGVGSLTIPANSLVAGRTYRIKLKGYVSGTNGDTSTLKVKLGTTELVSSTGTWQTLTDVGFTLEFDFTCRTTGATGTVAGDGYSLVSSGQGFSTVTMRALIGGTDTIDTTTSQTIDLTYQWSAAKAGNTITITNASVEVLN